MVKVQFSATVINHDTEETFSGWVDPSWNQFELRELSTDVRTWEFDTRAEAIEFADSKIGTLDDTGLSVVYSDDSVQNLETGEYWRYAVLID